MSGHEKEEWETELGRTALGWAELQHRWSDTASWAASRVKELRFHANCD